MFAFKSTRVSVALYQLFGGKLVSKYGGALAPSSAARLPEFSWCWADLFPQDPGVTGRHKNAVLRSEQHSFGKQP
ncbi:hypothetical protein [Propionimicrobium lymphophilum]|uniref:hypothetical protein n=1 Tax=Propionimicrobium lymphophilum TaxID=33012 RepID=UPI00040CD0FB|nr:hypothetical protein [Propionimicrobium lymphophilum]